MKVAKMLNIESHQPLENDTKKEQTHAHKERQIRDNGKAEGGGVSITISRRTDRLPLVSSALLCYAMCVCVCVRVVCVTL